MSSVSHLAGLLAYLIDELVAPTLSAASLFRQLVAPPAHLSEELIALPGELVTPLPHLSEELVAPYDTGCVPVSPAGRASDSPV